MDQKILLAEDDASVRETLTEVLRQENYDVVDVANGQAAIDACTSDVFGLVILDCLLPKVAGFDVAKVLRNRDDETPIIFMSGVLKGADQQREAREKYGARAYLTKPFDNARLLQAVRAILPQADAAPPPSLPAEGTLLEHPVLHLMWRAATEAQTGILELYGDSDRARIFVMRGRAAMAQHSDPMLNVGIELLRSGVLSADLYKQCMEAAVSRGIGLYEALKADALLTDAEARAAYKNLIPKVLERVVALTGHFRWIATDAFSSIVPVNSIPLLEPMLSGLRKVSEKDIEPHLTPRRPLRLAPGDNWSEFVGRLIEACGSDNITRGINGRATIAQLIEAGNNPNDRAMRCRQIYLLMSTMSVRASLEPIPMAAPASAPAAPVQANDARAAPAPRPTESGGAVVRTDGSAAPRPAGTTEKNDAEIRFTPQDQAARERISSKFEELKGQNHYAVLGLPTNADAAAVKKAYLVLARDFHTDVFAGLQLGSAQAKLDHVFQTIQTAYATLTDEKRRAEYDAKLSFEAEGGSSDVAAILEAESNFHKAQRLVERGELASALKIIERVLPVMPKNDEVLGYQKYCAWWQNKSAAAAPQVVKDLEAHWAAAPGALVLKEFQGWILMEVNDVKGAKAAFRKVLEIDARHPGAMRGARHLQRKLDEEAKNASSGLAKLLKR